VMLGITDGQLVGWEEGMLSGSDEGRLLGSIVYIMLIYDKMQNYLKIN
jgi:hypothetical protein